MFSSPFPVLNRSRRCVGRKGRVGLSWFWPFPSFAKSFDSSWNLNNSWIWNATVHSSREYMPVGHVVNYLFICWSETLMILRSKWIHRWQLWVVGCYPHRCWRMVTTSGFDGHDFRWKNPVASATRQFIFSASQLLEPIHSTEPTELRGTHGDNLSIHLIFPGLPACKHLSLILPRIFVVCWSSFFRCLGAYGASLKNSKSFLAICNASLQMPHVGLCWRTRSWDDIEIHWMHSWCIIAWNNMQVEVNQDDS